MRASLTGEILPSQLSPCARVKSTPIALTDFGTDGADSCQLAIPILDRDIIIGRIILGCHETFDVAHTDETQRITTANGSAGEVYKLAYQGVKTTTTIAYDALGATVKTALETIPALATSIVSVTRGGSSGSYTYDVVFDGDLGDVELLTAPPADITGDLTVTPAEAVKGKTKADNSAIVKVGTRALGVQDVDAIAIIDVAPDMAIGTSVVVGCGAMVSTLKNKYQGTYPGHACVPAGYAVEVNCYKNLVAGNAGRLAGHIEWWYADDVNPL